MAHHPFAGRYDLHTHSLASDGTTTPADVAREAARLGLEGFALTDHDTTAGWQEAREESARLGIDFLPGLELTTITRGPSVHLLAYGIDPEASELTRSMDTIRSSRLGRAERIVRNLTADFGLEWETFRAEFAPGTTVGRPHIADALVRRGFFPDRSTAFAQALHPGSKYYEKTYAIDTADGIRQVLAAGGLPVIAHPAANRQRFPLPVELLEELTEAGLWGIELDHPENRADWLPQLREAAMRLGLRITGSSDYHGEGKPNRLGEHTTPAELVAELRERVVAPR